ncbi:hypothetical protein COLO4_07641 [Corchorus olitorius]|uniref:Uncharacterized protein n=1 Tax=Corchorus olitorius TaxID=93759 RepID=A0A1R3KJ18_9ROSI|nr:hypothetical protein COLO4_07641 [Corchorus olitorius]
MKKRSKKKDWVWLPEIPLDLILVKLVSLRDFACFGAVCKRWNSIANDTRKKLCLLNESRPQPPFLLIPQYGSRYDRLRLYSVTQRKILHTQFQNPYPNSYPDLGWVGSSSGWLLVADQNLKILFNPFSYKAIILPPIPGAAKSFSRHESIMVPTCHFAGLQRNCIYYSTDDLPREDGGDAGMFNLDDGSIERYNNNLPLPLIDDVVWIMPTLTCHDNIKWQTKLSSMIHEELDS